MYIGKIRNVRGLSVVGVVRRGGGVVRGAGRVRVAGAWALQHHLQVAGHAHAGRGARRAAHVARHSHAAHAAHARRHRANTAAVHVTRSTTERQTLQW